MNNNKNIDDFFKEHFKNIGEPERSKERDEKVLSEIVSYARKSGMLNEEPLSFSQRVRKYFHDFNIFSMRYALPSLAAVLIIIVLVLSIFSQEEHKEELNTNSNISEINKDISHNIDTDIQNENKTEDNKTSEHIEKPNNNDTIISDLAVINYDFSTRSVSYAEDESINDVVEIIVQYFQKKSIDINFDGRYINTEWFIRNDRETQVVLELDKIRKDINLKVHQKSNSKDISGLNSYATTLKNDIEDLIMEKMFLNMAK